MCCGRKDEQKEGQRQNSIPPIHSLGGGGGGGGGGIKMKITLNYPKSATMGFFQELKNKFETAVVDEGVLLYI